MGKQNIGIGLRETISRVEHPGDFKDHTDGNAKTRTRRKGEAKSAAVSTLQ